MDSEFESVTCPVWKAFVAEVQVTDRWPCCLAVSKQRELNTDIQFVFCLRF